MKELPIDKHLFFEALWYLVEKGEISMCEYNKLLDKYSKEDEDKRLWKAKSFCIYQNIPIPCSTFNTDVMELTEAEAESWYKNWVKHLNDGHDDGFTLYSGGLFYKKDGEWIRYQIEKEK